MIIENSPTKKESVRVANYPLILGAVIPTTLIISLALLIPKLLPNKLVYGLSGYFGLRALWSMWSKRNIHKAPEILKGRRTATIKGDFVVFLIGARSNCVGQGLTGEFMKIKKEMDEVEKELKEHPEIGCLGSESYVGTNSEASHTVLIQYWRSLDHLSKFAANASNKHYSPWKRLMRFAKESTELGFWHETFSVKEGQYECIYVHCPAFGFANARQVTTEPASYAKATMKGRLGKGKGDASEWPEGFKADSNY